MKKKKTETKVHTRSKLMLQAHCLNQSIFFTTLVFLPIHSFTSDSIRLQPMIESNFCDCLETG
jgi:hypothetical protein